MSDVVVRVENLGKRYFLGHQTSGDLRQSFRQAVRTILKKDRSLKQDFWALKDLNFEIRRGDVVGIIGRNGAGKSTLLKILSRITQPTTGRFEIDGRVSSLLEVGTGFHFELTGRENIFLNGTILGMRRAEIKSKFDEIVAFSGVENFLDTPVKHYSSGMRVRLAFSIAAHLEPEILIVDEVLAVGDAEFQKKCLGKMDEVSKKQGRTVLFVSHNMSAIETLCTKGLLMASGSIAFNGSIQQCVNEYLRVIREKATGTNWDKTIQENEKALEICSTSIMVTGKQPNLKLVVRTLLTSNQVHKNAFIAYDLMYEDNTPVFQAIPTDKPFIEYNPHGQEVSSSIDLPPLIPGNYKLSVWVGSHYSETFDWQQEILFFRIETSPTSDRTQPHSKRNGFIVPTSTLLS